MNDLSHPSTVTAPKRAHGRALGDFRIAGAKTLHGLLPAEERLLVDAAHGNTCQVSSLDWKKAEDLEKLKSDEAYRIRAEFLRFLALGGDETAAVHEKGLWLQGGYIVGDIDLAGCQSVCSIVALDSYFSNSFVLRDANLRGLILNGSRIGGIAGDRVRIGGSVLLRGGFMAEGPVRFLGASLGGSLECDGGQFKNAGQTALDCDGVKIAGYLFLRYGFTAEGTVRLLGSQIGGDLDCTQGTFKNAGASALVCDRIRVTGSVFLGDGLVAEGEVRLPTADIGGVFTCMKGTFKNPGGSALLCDGAKIAGIVFLSGGLNAEGSVRFLNAELGRLLDCSQSTFKNPGGSALQCDAAKIAGSVFVNNGFSAEGEVRLPGADVGGSIVADGGSFRNAGGNAFNFDNTRIKAHVFMRSGFLAEGDVRMVAAEIGGNLEGDGGTFRNPGATALNGDGARILGSAYLRGGFVAEGDVRLPGAEIAGDLDCSGASFRSPGATALNCGGIKVARYLYMRAGFKAEGSMDFSGAQVQNLIDDDVAREQAGNFSLLLDGLTYARIAGAAPTDARTRIAWLMRQRQDYVSTDFRPQPFEQLTAVLRTMGHDTDARKIAIRKQRLMIPVRASRTVAPLRPFVWMLWQIHRVTSGFGYRPGRLIFLLLALWLAVGAFNYQAADAGVFGPADAQVWTNPELVDKCRANWTKCRATPELPGFHPLTYSADVMLPLLDLGQRRVWTPMRRDFMLSLPAPPDWLPDGTPIVQVYVPPWLPNWIMASQNFLGSLGALLFGAIVTGLIKKD